MLKRMIGIEVHKALRNKLFYASIIVGCAITIIALVYNVSIYQDELVMMNRPDANPGYEGFSLFNHWIGGEPFSPGSAIYFFVFPLLVAMPYGWSYCEEKQCGYVKEAVVRSGKKVYFLSKYIAIFLSGGLAMVIPLVFNFLTTAMFIPAVVPSPVYCTSTGVFFNSLMSMLYYSTPFLYVLFYLAIDFVFCGLIACFSYGVTCFVRNRAITVILPLFFLLALHYSRQFLFTSYEIAYKEISPMYFLRPVSAWYQASWTVITVETVVLFVITVFLSMIWERSHEIY